MAATCTESQLDLARANLAPRGWRSAVRLKQANVLELSPASAAGVLVTNPPYGVRLGELQDLAEFYPKLGDALKQRFAGWRACIFTADLRLPKLIGLKPTRRIPLYNGALECRLYVFELVCRKHATRAEQFAGVNGEVRSRGGSHASGPSRLSPLTRCSGDRCRP